MALKPLFLSVPVILWPCARHQAAEASADTAARASRSDDFSPCSIKAAGGPRGGGLRHSWTLLTCSTRNWLSSEPPSSSVNCTSTLSPSLSSSRLAPPVVEIHDEGLAVHDNLVGVAVDLLDSPLEVLGIGDTRCQQHRGGQRRSNDLAHCSTPVQGLECRRTVSDGFGSASGRGAGRGLSSRAHRDRRCAGSRGSGSSGVGRWQKRRRAKRASCIEAALLLMVRLSLRGRRQPAVRDRNQPCSREGSDVTVD